MGCCDMTHERIVATLRDAGCTEETIAQYLAACDAGDEKKARLLIEAHRKTLLEQFHKSCSCIDCLDYFVEKTTRGKTDNHAEKEST